jgi:hypothetical protein
MLELDLTIGWVPTKKSPGMGRKKKSEDSWNEKQKSELHYYYYCTSNR